MRVIYNSLYGDREEGVIILYNYTWLENHD